MAPLSSIRVVELGVMIAVPGATESLAGLGASVIKVEDTVRGDELRNYGSSRGGMSAWFANANAGKRSIAVDLTSDAGKKILWQLLADADVFVQGFRAGVMAKLGFDYEQVSERLPALIYCSSTGFGESGPYSDLPAYDPVIQALSGWAGIQSVDGKPTLHKTMVSDKTAAVYNTQAILAAIIQRYQTGKGCFIEASMLDSNIMYNWPDVMMQCSLLEDDGTPTSNGMPNIFSSYRLYACKDGFVTVATGNDKQWQSFCRAMEAEVLLNDEKLTSAKDRAANMVYFFNTLGEVVSKFDVAETVTRLRAADVPVAPVHKPEEVAADPHVIARGIIEEKYHPRVGRFLAAKPPAAMLGHTVTLTPAPMQGEHSRDILTELGYDDTTLSGLLESGVIKSFE